MSSDVFAYVGSYTAPERKAKATASPPAFASRQANR